jgi:hypothetical protein
VKVIGHNLERDLPRSIISKFTPMWTSAGSGSSEEDKNMKSEQMTQD